MNCGGGGGGGNYPVTILTATRRWDASVLLVHLFPSAPFTGPCRKWSQSRVHAGGNDSQEPGKGYGRIWFHGNYPLRGACYSKVGLKRVLWMSFTLGCSAWFVALRHPVLLLLWSVGLRGG